MFKDYYYYYLFCFFTLYLWLPFRFSAYDLQAGLHLCPLGRYIDMNKWHALQNLLQNKYTFCIKSSILLTSVVSVISFLSETKTQNYKIVANSFNCNLASCRIPF